MKANNIRQRMEFLELGDKLGFPRIGYATGRRVPAGEQGWQAFAEKAPLETLAPALRNARTLADYYGGPLQPGTLPPEPDPRQIAAERMAKARAAKAAKRAQRQATAAEVA